MATPVKVADCFCFICKTTTKRLFCLTNHKAVTEKYSFWIEQCLDIIIPEEVMPWIYVCGKCASLCESHSKFKKYAVDNYNNLQQCVRKKRMATTPPSALKVYLSLKESVAEQIIKSVERLNAIKLTEDSLGKEGIINNSKADTTDSFECTSWPMDHVYSTKKLDLEFLDSSRNQTSLENLLRITKCSDQTLCMEHQLTKLSQHGQSITFDNKPQQLSERNWFHDLVLELKNRCPVLLEVLSCAVGDKVDVESKIATIATMYGMILNCRNKKASAVQRLYTALAIRFHADNNLLKRLQKVHITLSDESKRNIIQEFADFSYSDIIRNISAGKSGKINGDNLDIYVTTNDIRMNNQNKDYHFFASDWTVNRVDLKRLDDSKPIMDEREKITVDYFIPNVEEKKRFSKSVKYLLG